ncbi:uncharacterized protein LOC6036033 [Culex quinquefasciatus]|uniref:uncharacterized protein LOC6036033 n=1 Tax=Culex quinquefasciatus TaxID=7176 RepID=UPI0018E3A86B|nr:uncharacterized protein LOC6036033 [Culex quinquefasciatus]
MKRNCFSQVMCCIFDQLSGPERRPLHLVCHGWYRMLTTKHYLLGRRLRLNPDNVELFEMNGEDVRKFPCVRVRDDESSPRSVNRRNFLSLLRRVVFGEDVLENVQELTLEGVQSDLLAELFGGCLVRFPNLKVLVVNCFEFDALHDVRKWNLSTSLTSLEISVSKQEEIQLIEAVAEQLTVLCIETTRLNLLLKCCDVGNFNKLRTLKLKSDTFFPERFSSPNDISDNFRKTLAQITTLSIVFRHNDFLLGYAPLLHYCTKLESLSIFGADLCVAACNVIRQLSCLKKLELLVRIEKDDYLLPWNLPNLANLHTYVENLAPLGEDLPALATIRISNHTIREGRFSNRPVERFYLKRYFSHFESILKLFLYDVYLEEDLLLQFPKMKVREIILRCVRTSSLILDIIYERAPAIFYLRFWDCCFLVSPRAKIPSFEALGRLLPHVRISHSSSKIIATSSSTAALDHDLPTILLS